MLRITTTEKKPSRVVLKLEGRVTSDWVDVLDREIRGHMADGTKVRLDFCGVTFVDKRGAKVLRDLLNGGVATDNCSGLIDMLLGEEGE